MFIGHGEKEGSLTRNCFSRGAVILLSNFRKYKYFGFRIKGKQEKLLWPMQRENFKTCFQKTLQIQPPIENLGKFSLRVTIMQVFCD